MPLIPNSVKGIIKSNPNLYHSYHRFYTNSRLYYKILQKIIWNILDKKQDSKKLMVNIGGGLFFRRHWKAMDFPSDWYRFQPGIIDFEFDLMSQKLFPFKDNSVRFFYSSHTFEHIPPINMISCM